MDRKILITGASGMLGHYLKKIFVDDSLTTLGRSESNNIRCDLTVSAPDLGGSAFEGVIHAAGTEEEDDAPALNERGTSNLLKALDAAPPKWIVFISSHQVYSRDAGCDIEEIHSTWPSSKAGQSKARAENLLRRWAERNGVVLTVLRPAYMFGQGIKGEMGRLFTTVVNGSYIHIRDNDARLSVVTALDVAKAALAVCATGGTFNVADADSPTLEALTEAMSQNAGTSKRMTHLPRKWADWIWRCFKFVPLVRRELSPETLKRRSTSFTLDASALREHLPEMFNTIEVIARTSTSYPYEEE